MQRDDPSVSWTVNRLPSWKRNTPAPATVGKWTLVGPEQVLEGWGEPVSACSSRKVNGPSVPLPAKFPSSVFVSGCSFIVLGSTVPENVIFTGLCCAYTLATPRLSISASIAMFFIAASLSFGGDILTACSPPVGAGKIGQQKRPHSIIFPARGEGASDGRILCGNHDAVESLERRRSECAGTAGRAGLSRIAPDGPS